MDIKLATALLCAATAVSTACLGDALASDDFGIDRSMNTIERFHELYNRRDYQQIYAEYDDSYSAEMSPQKNSEMFSRVRKEFGRFISATSVLSKSKIRHGEQVFIVTEVATFECGTVNEEFIFKRSNTIGKLLAYIVD
jgi:hypothetical protein